MFLKSFSKWEKDIKTCFTVIQWEGVDCVLCALGVCPHIRLCVTRLPFHPFKLFLSIFHTINPPTYLRPRSIIPSDFRPKFFNVFILSRNTTCYTPTDSKHTDAICSVRNTWHFPLFCYLLQVRTQPTGSESSDIFN